jgi:Protein of unknown function (DUF3422)
MSGAPQGDREATFQDTGVHAACFARPRSGRGPTDPAAAAKAREALEAFCLDRAYPAPAPEAKQHRVELPPAILRWEHHGEFMTYSWEFAQEAPKAGLGTNHAQSL